MADFLSSFWLKNKTPRAETAREIRSIARVLGDNRLFEAMEAASILMKRDIVFASSLYLSGAAGEK